MLPRLWAIARNTWRESLRDRLLVTVFAFVAAIVAGALLFDHGPGQATATLDLCLSAMSAAGTLLAVFLGTSLVHKELDKRTLFVVLAKPISRQEYLVGKYVGLMATLAAIVLMMAVALAVVMAAVGHVDGRLFAVLAGNFVQLALLTSIAFLFATITGAMPAALYTIGLYVLGQQALMIKEFADSEVKLHAFNAIVGRALYYILPNFEAFDFKNTVLYGGTLPWGAWACGLAYGAIASAALVALASVAWDERELT
jgi:ABC-type transport system involved in multi-copper enzyme maturation permease subunit